MTAVTESWGAALRARREAAHLSGAELAQLAGVSRETVRSLERTGMAWARTWRRVLGAMDEWERRGGGVQ